MSYLLTWLPVLVLAMLGTILALRRTYRQFPFFSLYVYFATLVGLLRYAASRYSPTMHFYVYWISELAGAVLVTLALYEIFLRRMFTGFQRVRIFRILFPVAAAGTLLLTILSAVEASDTSAAFMRASRAFDFVRTAIIVFFIALMILMGRAWGRYDLGVTLGFGLQAAAALANAALRVKLGRRLGAVDMLESVTFDLACLIWLITFWKPEKPAVVAAPDQLDPELLHEARAAENVLKDWLTPGKSKQKGAGQ